MKKLFLLLFLTPLCFSQEVRYDNAATTVGNPVSGSAGAAGPLVPILGIANAQINVCAVTTPTPCITPLVTFTDNTGTTQCPIHTPLTRPNVIGCFASADAQGDWGMWVPPGTAFQYMITASYGTFGPYSANAPGSTGGGGGVAPPAFAVQFANAAITGPQTDNTFTFTPVGHILSTFANAINATNPAFSALTDIPNNGSSAVVLGLNMNTSGLHQGPGFSSAFAAFQMSGTCANTGWTTGGNQLSPTGPDWATCFGLVTNTTSFSPGIFQGVNGTINAYKEGDNQAGGFTVNWAGGNVDPAGEGNTGIGIHDTQVPAAFYSTGTVTITGAPGATSVTLTSPDGHGGFVAPFEVTNATVYDTQTPLLSNFHATDVNTIYPNMGVYTFPVDVSVTPSTQGSLVAIQYLTWTAGAAHLAGDQLNVAAARWVCLQNGNSTSGSMPAFTGGAGTVVTDGTTSWAWGGDIEPGIFASLNPAAPTPVTATFDMNYGPGTALINDTSSTASWLGGGQIEKVKVSNVGSFYGAVTLVTQNALGTGCIDGFHTVNATGGGGTGAQLFAGCSGGVPFFIFLLTPGRGYTSIPTFTLPGPSSATFNVTVSSKVQDVVLTARKTHGVFPLNPSSSIWQGGTHGYMNSGYWAGQGWPAQYPILGAVDSSHLAGELVLEGNFQPPTTMYAACSASAAVTSLTTTGTTVTGNLGTTLCGPYYVGIAPTNASIKTAVVSCPGNSSFNSSAATSFSVDPTRFVITWSQTGASGTCANATLSYPPSATAETLYAGAEITQACTQASTTTTCPLDNNDVTFTSGHTYATGPNPAAAGYGILDQFVVNAPDPSDARQAISVSMNGNGANGPTAGLFIQNLNQVGTPNAGFYLGQGGSYFPPYGLHLHGLFQNVLIADPAPPGFTSIFFGCPLTGCNDLTHQKFIGAMQGAMPLELWPESNTWAFTNDNNLLVQNGFVEGGQSIGVNGGGSQQPTGPNSEFFTTPTFTFSNFLALGRGTTADPITFFAQPNNGAQDATLGTGQRVAGEVYVGALPPGPCATYNIGTPGGQTYNYLIAGITLTGGHTTYVTTTTASGNATLDGTNYNNPTCNINAGIVTQEVWRGTNTAGLPLGRIAHGVLNNNPIGYDQGQTPDISGSPTNTDTSGHLYVANIADGCLNIASGVVGGTGSPCGSGGGGGVSSINGTAGAFTFTGAGVSCTTTTCTFTGSGAGIGSITWAMPSFLTASPTTISASGTQTFSLATQSANTVFGNFTGSSAAPTFSATPTFSGANITALNATQLTSGTVPAARLPNPSASTLGGIESYAPVSHQWINTISTSGVPSSTQPSFSDLSGNIAISQIAGGTGASSSTFLRGDNTWQPASGVLADCTDTTGVSFICTVPIEAPVFQGTGTTPSALSLPSGTGSIPALAAGSAGFAAPVSGGTPYLIKFPATITAGIPTLATPGTADGVNESAMTVTPLNGAAGGIVTGPISSVNNDAVIFNGTTGQIADSGGPMPATLSSVSHNFLTSYTKSTGVFTQAQPGLGDIAAGSSSTGTFDFSGATQIKLPVAAAYASAANGEIGYDTTNLNWHIWDAAADNFVAVFPVASPPTSGNCVKFVKTTNSWTLADAGGTCTVSGGVTSLTGAGVITNSASTDAVTLTVAGTSGGVPYFSSSSAWASSAALAANGIVLGGGAGAAPATVGGITTDGTSKLELGTAGSTIGSVQLFNATSGSITLTPATGALGAVTATLPANTGVVAELNLAQTFSALQTFGSNASIAATAHGVLLSENTSAVVATAVGATNTVLHGNTGADPTYSAVATADIAANAVTSAKVDSSVVTDAGNTTTTANQVAVSTTTAGAQKYIDFPERFYIPAANCNNTTAGAEFPVDSFRRDRGACRAGTNNPWRLHHDHRHRLPHSRSSRLCFRLIGTLRPDPISHSISPRRVIRPTVIPSFLRSRFPALRQRTEQSQTMPHSRRLKARAQ